VVICSASWAGVLPVGVKPVAFGLVPEPTTVTMTAAIPATTATAAAVTAMMSLRRFLGFPRRPLPDDPGEPGGPGGPQGPPGPCGSWGSGPTARKGAVEGSDAYQGPEDLLLPPESLATPATVLTAQIHGN
jgi:hypothetical protein